VSKSKVDVLEKEITNLSKVMFRVCRHTRTQYR